MIKEHNIGVLNENDLHLSLKKEFQLNGDQIEKKVEGYTIDIVRGNKLIEIQTRNLGALKKKLENLINLYKIDIIHPIIKKKLIIKLSKTNKIISSRKSPKAGRIEEIFKELIYITKFAQHPNFCLIIPIVDVNEYWLDDGAGSWRRKGWSIVNKKLSKIHTVRTFSTESDYLNLIPKSVPEIFTNKDLSGTKKLPIRLTRKMTFCLRKMQLLEIVGKKGNAHLYKISGKVVE